VEGIPDRGTNILTAEELSVAPSPQVLTVVSPVVFGILLWIASWCIITTLVYTICRHREKQCKLYHDRIEVIPLVLLIRLTKRVPVADWFENNRIARGFFAIAGTISFIVSLAIFYSISFSYVSQLLKRLLGLTEQVSMPPPFQPILPGITIDLEMFLYMLPSISLAIVAHELFHAIAARADKIPIKSAGILFAIGTIFGAFVEPDEEKVKNSSLASRARLYMAGITANMFLALLFFAVLSVFGTQYAVLVTSVQINSPAYNAGIQPGDVILEVDGHKIHSIWDLKQALQEKLCNNIVVRHANGQTELLTVCRKANEKYIGVYVGEVPASLVGLGPETARAIYYIIFWGFVINLSLAMINAAPLFVTDGAQLLNDMLVAVGGKVGKTVSLSVQIVTLLLLLLGVNLRVIG